MKDSLLDLIVCPRTGERLELVAPRREGDEVVSGTLRSAASGHVYEVRDGVPRLLAGPLRDAEERTGEHFGWQWTRFDRLLDAAEEREQLLDWVSPLQPADLRGAVVLDAGCGMGRLAEAAAWFGPRAVLAVDLSRAVDAAFRRCGRSPNVHVVQADLHALPLPQGERAVVDVAWSIGVLHHLPDPEAGLKAVLGSVRRGGRFHGWVYGREGNEWIRGLVDPLRRRVTSRLPPLALLGISALLAAPLHAASRGVHGAGLAERVPYGAYLDWLGRWRWRHTHHVVFDHLGPPVAHYVAREEVERWVAAAGLAEARISARNANSWRFSGRVP